jgi:ABC-type branched-subunit amino acid transport system substrate-binding protein
VLVVDDTLEIGREVADSFERAYREAGGQTVRHALNEGADPATVLDPLADGDGAPGAVFFGGFTPTGGPELRSAMADAGYGELPFLTWDGVFDGSGADQGSFISEAGEAAAGSYITHSGVPPPRSDFIDRFRAAYGFEPSEYTGAAYACTEVILESLRAAARTGPSADGLREAVRAYAVDPTHRYETVVGTVGFNENGDSMRQFVTFYRVEMSAAGGDGDWVIVTQRDFAPAP